jgi:hypothetical protein
MRGTIPAEKGVVWFKTGFLPMVGQDVDYGWDPVSIAWVQVCGACVCDFVYVRGCRCMRVSVCLLRDFMFFANGGEG